MRRSAPTPKSQSAKVPRGLRKELVTALGTSKGRPRNQDLGEDDELIALCRRVLAHAANGNDNNDDDSDGGDSDDNSDDDSDDDEDASWYDCWVDKPVGERGRRTKDDRVGWGTADILKVAGITEDQYKRYMKSAFRLCDYYFDTTQSFSHNQATRPDKYTLIVEKMKELHPRFRFHTADWLTRHLVVTHCQSKFRSFYELGEDPDVAVYRRILRKQEQKHKKASQRTLSNRLKPPKQPLLSAVRPSARIGKKRKTRAASEPGSDAAIPWATFKPRIWRTRNIRDANEDNDVGGDLADPWDEAMVKAVVEKEVDKGKGKAKAVDLDEEPAPKRYSTRTRKVINPRLDHLMPSSPRLTRRSSAKRATRKSSLT